MSSTEDLRELAIVTTRKAGELLRQHWYAPRQIASKGYRDWVTSSDLAAQELIVEHIRAQYPEHGFLAEESGTGGSAAIADREHDVVWIIDPIDGTSNFSRLQPNYCVSIAAARLEGGRKDTGQWQIVVGAIFDPMRDELFAASAGRGATLNGAPLLVSDTSSFEPAVIGLDWSRQNRQRTIILDALGRLAFKVHTIRAIGSAALALAWVAAGRLDAYFNLQLSAWDVAAADLMIREAGGRVTNLSGKPWMLDSGGCIASNGLLHEAFSQHLFPAE